MRENKFSILRDIEYLRKREFLILNSKNSSDHFERNGLLSILNNFYPWIFPIVKTRAEAKEIYPEFPKTVEDRLSKPEVIK